MAKKNRGFTLIEMLVVMAISMILLGLVFYPVAKSFQLTRQAETMVASQDAARNAMQQVSRELGQAMYVFDNAQLPISPYGSDLPDGVTASNAQTPIMLPVAQPNGTTQWFVLPYGKIDFILPKMYMHCNNPDHPAGKPRDYPRDIQMGTRTELRDWPDCPYCQAAGIVATDVEARPKTPLEQDVTVVRYFLGLYRNDLGGGNPVNAGWVSPWAKNVVDGTENQVVLYRVEFDPHDPSLFSDPDETIDQRLSDPVFFYRPSTHAAWMAKARIVGVGKFEDLVTATYGADGTVLTVQPSVTFRNASIQNDMFTPTNTLDKLDEYPTAPPMLFAGSYGYWTPDARVDVMRGDYVNDPTTGEDFFTTMRDDGSLVVMKRVPSSGGNWTETVEFNITDYRNNGFVPPDSVAPLEMAFDIDCDKGTAIYSLKPPRVSKDSTGPVCTFDPAAINQGFHDVYNGVGGAPGDRYGARRNVLVATSDPTVSNQYLKNSRVVPGSEKIIGPDMIAGPHFGEPIRYERVPLGLRYPGVNQYQIDCDTGWIMFSPDPNLDLPQLDQNGRPTQIQVYYLIYFNRMDDVIRGDYLTKGLIDVQLGMRMFDPDQGKLCEVDLTDSVKIRNAKR